MSAEIYVCSGRGGGIEEEKKLQQNKWWIGGALHVFSKIPRALLVVQVWPYATDSPVHSTAYAQMVTTGSASD